MLIDTKPAGQQWYDNYDPRAAMIRRVIDRNIQERMWFMIPNGLATGYDESIIGRRRDVTLIISDTMRPLRLHYDNRLMGNKTICL